MYSMHLATVDRDGVGIDANPSSVGNLELESRESQFLASGLGIRESCLIQTKMNEADGRREPILPAFQ